MVGYMPWMVGCVQRPWGRVVSVGVLALMLVVVVCFSPVSGRDPSRMEIKVVDPGPPSVVSVTDGAVVRADGNVTFLTDPTYDAISPLPAGHRWVAATRQGAIDETGALWVRPPPLPIGPLNPDFFDLYCVSGHSCTYRWRKALSLSPSADKYIAVSSTHGNPRIFTVKVNSQGQSILEVGQCAVFGGVEWCWGLDEKIKTDTSALNAGRDPKRGNARIDPPIPGWQSFIAGYDYGLAVSSDGRVFGVGNTADGQNQLRGRYTDVATATYVGTFIKNRYSLGVTEGGTIDFAGDDPNHIRSDIQAANLTNVRMVAAGPDRALALTTHGRIYTFGETTLWPSEYASFATTDGSRTSIAAAPLPLPDDAILSRPNCMFVVGLTPGTRGTVKGPLHLVPPAEFPTAAVDPAIQATLYGTTIEHFPTGYTRISSPNSGDVWVNDNEAPRAFTPGPHHEVPATHVIEIPDDSQIVDTSDSSYDVYDKFKTKIFSAVSHEPPRQTGNAPTLRCSNTLCDPAGYLAHSWMAFASAPILPLTMLGEFSTQITVPAKPTVTLTEEQNMDWHYSHAFAIFPSLSLKNIFVFSEGGIFQPVLEFNWKDKHTRVTNENLNEYSIAVWDLKKKTDNLHSVRRYGLSPGDVVQATIKWVNDEDNRPTWFGEIYSLNNPSVRASLKATKFTATDVCIDTTLEGYIEVLNTTDLETIKKLRCSAGLPGEIKFHHIFVQDFRNGQNITPMFSSQVNRNDWNETQFPELKVSIPQPPSNIIITTGNYAGNTSIHSLNASGGLIEP